MLSLFYCGCVLSEHLSIMSVVVVHLQSDCGRLREVVDAHKIWVSEYVFLHPSEYLLKFVNRDDNSCKLSKACSNTIYHWKDRKKNF